MQARRARRAIVGAVGERAQEPRRHPSWTGARPAAVAVLALASLLAAPRAMAGFCETGVVHNYLKPLEEMPALRSVPVTGSLPFGPAGLFIGERAVGPVVAGKTLAGFSLSFGSRMEAPSPRLGWTVVARLVRVARRERVRRLLEKRTARLARMNPGERRRFSFRVSGKPSLYRLEIEFRNREGRRIGRFGEYLRVLGPNRKARLALKGTSFRRGETVSPRLENYGTETLLYGLDYSIQFHDGTEWARSPSFPPQPVLRIGLRTGPGETAACWKVTIPEDAPPGRYRFVWSGRASGGAIPRRAVPLTLATEFRVLPPAG